jgi:hypothetical protein
MKERKLARPVGRVEKEKNTDRNDSSGYFGSLSYEAHA